MKILFISHSSSMYGAPKSMFNLIKDLKERYNVEAIVVTPQEGELVQELENIDVKCIVSKYYWWMTDKDYCSSYINKFKNFLRIILNKIHFISLYNKLKKYNFDIVHSNTSVCEIGYNLSRKFNVPHIWHIREDAKNAFNLSYIYSNNIVRKYYKKTKYLIGVSNFVIKKQKIFNGLENTKIIYDGVESNNLTKTSEHYRRNIINLCIVGSLDDNKNQMEALLAINILVNKGINNIRLHIIGDGLKSYKDTLNKYIRDNELEDYVIFYGYSNNIYNILKDMHIGLMCSKNEAFGRVTVEYMFSYIPVIGSNTGGTREIIIDNKTGFLYELGDAIDLSNKINYFINNRTDIKLMGYNGFNIASQKFTVKKNTDNIYKLYESIYKNN